MDGFKKDNDGYKYILSIIDCWSKFAFCFPMKNIQCATVIDCLQKLFSKADNIPEKISTDRGSGEMT